MSTLDFGIEFYRFQRGWYARFLESLEKGGQVAGTADAGTRGRKRRSISGKITEGETP